ncbi:MAG TPA: outer membrane protein transport protein [Candidatus Paceibacterota bacterium]|nr:outer membrane protein transport protein [Candidatus Paceibacterota bacterium]
MKPTKVNNAPTRFASALVSGAACTLCAHAGGISLYEIATPDVGLASAGYAARAQDASTVFRNPAGMSLLAGAQFQGGLQLTYGDVAFSKNADDTSPSLRDDGDGGNAVGALPAGGLFLVQPLSDRFAVGIGALSYCGLMEEFDDNWVGRYYVQKGSLLGMSLMPSVSFKATEWLSIGAGLNAMYGYMNTEVAVRTLAPGDGQLTIKDETWGFGANVGVLVEPRKGTRFGVTYLSPVGLDFEERPTFSNLGGLGGGIFANPPQLDLGVTVPQSVMFSAYHELNPRWALMVNVGWQNWEQFGKVDVGVDAENPTSLSKNLKHQDTLHGAIGAQYRISDHWTLSGGAAYDSSAVDDADRTLSLPMGEAYRIGLGAHWQVSEKVNLGAAYEFLWSGDMPVVQDSNYRGRVSGSFRDSWFSFVTVDLTWKF